MSNTETSGATASIIQVVTSVTHHIDARRWRELQELFASQVQTDYTSLFGGTPQQQSSEALIAGWRQALQRVATHHQLGPILVQLQSNRAQAECHVRALHQVPGAPGGEYWDVLGHYVFGLTEQQGQWLIDAMKLETHIQVGNRSLLAEAAKV